MWLYNSFIDNNGMTWKYTLTDSLTFALSNLSANVGVDILGSFFNYSNESLSGMIMNPLLAGFIYMYLYQYFVKYNDDFNLQSNNRSNSMNFMLGGGLDILVKFIWNPLLSLFGLKHY